MRKISMVILLLVLAVIIAVAAVSYTPAGKRVYGYHESASGTNEPSCFFSLGDFKGGLHMGPCGIGEAVNWSYQISLSGAGDRFTFDRVDVEPDALFGQERPSSGEILLDRMKNQVTISLKVAHGKDLEDFIGNGTFTINKKP